MKNRFYMIPGQRPPNQPETEGRLPRLLPSELSGTDFRYSVSPLWATPTPLIWPVDPAAVLYEAHDFPGIGFGLRNLVQGVLRQSGGKFRVVCSIFHKYMTIPFCSIIYESVSQALWLQE